MYKLWIGIVLLIANRKDRLILFSVQCVISVDYINYGGNLLEKLHRITSMRVSVRNKNNTITFVRCSPPCFLPSAFRNYGWNYFKGDSHRGFF